MTTEEIHKFQKRARYVARKNGFSSEFADDFAQELILAFLENPDRRSTVDQFFVDYLRGTYGDTRSDNGRTKSKAILSVCSLDAARNIEAVSECKYEDGGSAFLFRGREAELYQAYFVDQKTEKDIGKELGVTESRVCQMLSVLKKEIQEQAILEQGLERMEWDKGFTKFNIDWIKL